MRKFVDARRILLFKPFRSATIRARSIDLQGTVQSYVNYLNDKGNILGKNSHQ